MGSSRKSTTKPPKVAHNEEQPATNQIFEEDSPVDHDSTQDNPIKPIRTPIQIQVSATPKPKRPPRVILHEFDLHPETPPTLAQFIDSLDDTSQGEYIRHIKMLSVDQMWELEDKRQAVLQEFPRAFAHDLTPEEQSKVAMLFQLQEPLISRSTQVQLLFTLFITVCLVVFCYFNLNINLVYHLHTLIAYLLSPDPSLERPQALTFLLDQFIPRAHHERILPSRSPEQHPATVDSVPSDQGYIIDTPQAPEFRQDEEVQAARVKTEL